MTGALQTYARKTKIPIDTLNFQTIVLQKHEAELAVGPENGVYIYGLYLQGARWDTKVRCDRTTPLSLMFICKLSTAQIRVHKNAHARGQTHTYTSTCTYTKTRTDIPTHTQTQTRTHMRTHKRT